MIYLIDKHNIQCIYYQKIISKLSYCFRTLQSTIFQFFSQTLLITTSNHNVVKNISFLDKYSSCNVLDQQTESLKTHPN